MDIGAYTFKEFHRLAENFHEKKANYLAISRFFNYGENKSPLSLVDAVQRRLVQRRIFGPCVA